MGFFMKQLPQPGDRRGIPAERRRDRGVPEPPYFAFAVSVLRDRHMAGPVPASGEGIDNPPDVASATNFCRETDHPHQGAPRAGATEQYASAMGTHA